MFSLYPQPLGYCFLLVRFEKKSPSGMRLALNSLCSSDWPWVCVSITDLCYQAQQSSLGQLILKRVDAFRLSMSGLEFECTMCSWMIPEVCFLMALLRWSRLSLQPLCSLTESVYLCTDSILSSLNSRVPSYLRSIPD